MRTRFYYIKDNSTVSDELIECFILSDGSVWRNNFRTCESQSSVVGFDDFIIECPEISWEIID